MKEFSVRQLLERVETGSRVCGYARKEGLRQQRVGRVRGAQRRVGGRHPALLLRAEGNSGRICGHAWQEGVNFTSILVVASLYVSFFKAFLYFQLVFVIFWQKEIGEVLSLVVLPKCFGKFGKFH